MTMETTEPAANLIDQAKAEISARRRKAAATLRELLLRADNPKRGDKEALADAMGALGLRFEDLQELKESAETAERYAKLLAQEGDCVCRRSAGFRSLAEIDEWQKQEHIRVDRQADEKRRELNAERGPIERLYNEIREARQQAVNVAAKWLMLTEGITRDEVNRRLSGLQPEEQLAYREQ
jgi:hypothetical protein